ncbi:hypothetical protein Cgig2_021808 [Carnegiea gigantea]|uniref:Uncharacterized protein n=1 Tax=Carnegiea gigantea TaxID=171969 RepID=A0A9Q1QF13_9CARY|nr:hypothetical protein Cgig2_021808 [Carnegiea gigantea]
MTRFAWKGQLRGAQQVLTTEQGPRIAVPTMVFDGKEAPRFASPHNDLVVVEIKIASAITRRILIDTEAHTPGVRHRPLDTPHPALRRDPAPRLRPAGACPHNGGRPRSRPHPETPGQVSARPCAGCVTYVYDLADSPAPWLGPPARSPQQPLLQLWKGHSLVGTLSPFAQLPSPLFLPSSSPGVVGAGPLASPACGAPPRPESLWRRP